MGAREAKALVCAGERAEHLCPLLDGEVVLLEPRQFGVGGRDSGREDYQCVLPVAAGRRDLVNVLLIMDLHALALQFVGERCRRAVVARHDEVAVQEVACEGAHANASRSDEIDSLDIFQFHNFFFIVQSV